MATIATQFATLRFEQNMNVGQHFAWTYGFLLLNLTIKRLKQGAFCDFKVFIRASKFIEVLGRLLGRANIVTVLSWYGLVKNDCQPIHCWTMLLDR